VEQETQDNEVTVRTQTRTCLRCGETKVNVKNTRVAIDEVEPPLGDSQTDTDVQEREPTPDNHENAPYAFGGTPDETTAIEEDPAPTETTMETDEQPTSDDAVILDDEPSSVTPDTGFGGGEVIEHAFGDTQHATSEPSQTQYNHGAFKGSALDEYDMSSDPGEILEDDSTPESEEPKRAVRTHGETNHVPSDSRVLRCPSCTFSEQHAGSSLREGDICGKCGGSYLVLITPPE
jgi:ferredoxin-like protein FixX